MDRPIQSFTYIYTQVYTIYLYVELVPRKKRERERWRTRREKWLLPSTFLLLLLLLAFIEERNSIGQGEADGATNGCRTGRRAFNRLHEALEYWIDMMQLSFSSFSIIFQHTRTHTYIYTRSLSLSPGCTLSDKHGQEDSERDTLPTKKREMELDWIFMSPSLPVLLQCALHTKKEKKESKIDWLSF